MSQNNKVTSGPVSGWHCDVFPTSTNSSGEEQVFSQLQVWVLNFLLSVRIKSQWKYRSGTDRQRDKVTGSVVYSSQRATENDFCSWNKTKTRVEGQLPLLFWLISTPKQTFPKCLRSADCRYSVKDPTGCTALYLLGLEGKCSVSSEFIKSSTAPSSLCSNPNLICL